MKNFSPMNNLLFGVIIGILLTLSFLTLSKYYQYDYSSPQINSPKGNQRVTPSDNSNKTICNSDDDCTSSCSFGCVNQQWLKGKADCAAEMYYECSCINNTCTQ